MTNQPQSGLAVEATSWSTWIARFLLFAQLARCAVMIFTRRFNPDEYEHLHASWLLLQDSRPYADFFEHHHPLLWFLLEPLVAIAPDSFSVMFVGRIVMWFFYVASTALLIAIGRQICGPVAGLWAGVIWTAMAPVQDSAVEIRPDMPMTFFLLLSYWFALPRGRSLLVASGASFGIAFLFLQKAILFLPALLLVVLLRPSDAKLSVARRLAWMSLGSSFPLVLGALYLTTTGTAEDWWTWCVHFNTTAPPVPGSWYQLGFWQLRVATIEANTLPMVAIAVGGFLLFRRADWRRYLPLVAGALFLLASLILTRRPYNQYLIPVLTLPAILGGSAIGALLASIRPARTATLTALLLATVIAVQNRPRLRDVEDDLFQELQVQRERFAYVLAHTSREDLVFQGNPPFCIHRRDSTFFWFLPFDLPLRAQRLGLYPEWSFRDCVLEKRPAFISIGRARTYPGEDTYGLHHQWLVETAGYKWIKRLSLYERVRPAEVPEGR